MKAIVLAAGQGVRLRPMTSDRPKCMVNLNGRPILEYQLKAFKSQGINNVHVVGGYKAEMLPNSDVSVHLNKNYLNTNMVSTLFCAEKILTSAEDIIISYGDIVFDEHVLKSLIKSDAPLSVVFDTEWRKYWDARMPNPLDDAETFKFEGDYRVRELGKKPKSYEDISGQYIGLIKIKSSHVKSFVSARKKLESSNKCNQYEFDNMYMTSFIQHLIDNGWDVRGIPISNSWAEIDCISDIEVASEFCNILD